MINSKIFSLGEINLPEFNDDKLYMHPFNLNSKILALPNVFGRWCDVILKMLSYASFADGIAYLTIDQKQVKTGKTHRRGGPHVDGNYLYGWGRGGGSGWLTGTVGRVLSDEKHRLQYCSPHGGALIVSNYEACCAWQGKFTGKPEQGGNCEHIKAQLTSNRKLTLAANTVYFMNSTCVHESLPLDKDVNRTLVRITLPANFNPVNFNRKFHHE